MCVELAQHYLSNSYLKNYFATFCSCLDKVKIKFALLDFVLSFVYVLFAFFIKQFLDLLYIVPVIFDIFAIVNKFLFCFKLP